MKEELEQINKKLDDILEKLDILYKLFWAYVATLQDSGD